MPQIYFAQHLCKPSDIVGDEPEGLDLFLRNNGLRSNDVISPGRAYSPDCGNPQTLTLVRKINAMPVQDRMVLARQADAMGDDTHCLTEFFHDNFCIEKVQWMNSLIGAGASATQLRLEGFQKALFEYLKTLHELRELQGANAHGRGIGHRTHNLRKEAATKFQAMHRAYGTELNRLAPVALRDKNRGNALSNAKRGITLAVRKPNGKPDPGLNVASTKQVTRMGTYATIVRNTGRAVIVADAGLRGTKVYNVHKESGDWMRESSLQLTGFGAGGAAGIQTGKLTMGLGVAGAAKFGLLAAGPMGWAVLGGIVCVSIGAGYVVGTRIDKVGQAFASWLWDR